MLKPIYSVLLSAPLLLSTLSCQNPGAGDASVTPTTATTPVAATTPAISGPYQTCRLAGQDVKVAILNADANEVVIINGKSYGLYHERDFTYIYDSQGRISSEEVKEWVNNGRVLITLYKYGPSTVEREYWIVHDGKVGSNSATLNSTGYIVNDGSTTYTYDANGYLTRQKSKDDTILWEIKDGNTVKRTSTKKSDITYGYELTKPSQPAISNLFGKTNRNLLIRQEFTGTDFTGTTLYLTTYQYVFDKQGRVTRRIELNGTDRIPTKVIDYTYTCK